MYWHIWVVPGLLAVRPAWGVIALPLLARLYVRRTDLGGMGPAHRPPFRTRLELAEDLLLWALMGLSHWSKALSVAADGAA
jgi:hypothetical protein